MACNVVLFTHSPKKKNGSAFETIMKMEFTTEGRNTDAAEK